MGPDTTNYTYTVPLVIGFDSEWVYRSNMQRNHVLSYQFAGRSADGAWSGIIYTEGPEQKNRLRLRDLMGRAIEAGLSQGPLTQWPTELYACAHFTRADLSTFQDFAVPAERFDHEALCVCEAEATVCCWNAALAPRFPSVLDDLVAGTIKVTAFVASPHLKTHALRAHDVDPHETEVAPDVFVIPRQFPAAVSK